ncbi:MAG: hypothetical protein IT445_11190 [Phycisphaeraceae bacterium]|nr:hypothetical protein [Phycisphaeraceae bacterium]
MAAIDTIRPDLLKHHPSTAEASCPMADTIHRRFFIVGILVILTVGAGWGV